MSNPLLSICIPTYNRAVFLKRMCESIFDRLDEESLAQLEVCISDNASPDHTLSVVSDLHAKYPRNVVFKTNDKNYGPAYNAFEVLKMATGEYVWCVGDDDILMEGATSYLLSLIDQIKSGAETTLFFIKFYSRIGNKVVFKGFDSLESEKAYDKEESERYFIEDKFYSNGFLGAQIFHRGMVKSYFDQLVERDSRNTWPQLAFLLHSFKILKKIIVTKPVIFQTGDGLYWLLSNWILVLFYKIEVLDKALFKKEVTEHMATKICSGILLSFGTVRLAIAAKIEEPERYLSVVKKISDYRSSNSRMQHRINIFKSILKAVRFIPLPLLEAGYFLYTRALGIKDFRKDENNPSLPSKHKREGLSA